MSLRGFTARLCRISTISVIFIAVATNTTNAVQSTDAIRQSVNAAFIPTNFHASTYINVRKIARSRLVDGLEIDRLLPNGSVFAIVGSKNIDNIVSAGHYPTSWSEEGIAAQKQAIVVRGIEAFDVPQIVEAYRLAPATIVDDVQAYRVDTQVLLQYLAFADARTLLLATDEATLKAMVAAREGSDSLLAAQVKSLPAECDLGFAVTFEPLRDGLAKLTRDNPTPAPFQAVNDLPDQVRALSGSLDLTGLRLLKIDVHAYDEDAAAKLKATLDEYLGLAESLWILNARRIIASASEDAGDEFGKALAVFAKQFFESRSVTKRDTLVTATWRRPDGMDALEKTFPGMIRSLLQTLSFNARMRRLHHIGTAIESYRAKHGHYPRPAICDENGKPLLSWRVALLPFQGEAEAEFHKEFHLDEPWDSPHNKQLLKRMPVIYTSDNEHRGKTRFLAVVDDRSVFAPGMGKPVDEFSDSKDGTMLVLEVGPDKAVPWTKPSDFTVEKKALLSGLGEVDGFRGRAFMALFANQGVSALPATIDEDVLLPMFTRDGGEQIDWDAADLDQAP